MIVVKSNERGGADHGWLNSKHSFSFADYYNPSMMGFSVLRVINEDWIAAHTGFPTHGHKDMEIITYVIEGSLEHKDTLGNTAIIRPGEVQKMTAGTGIKHSEVNPEPEKTTHLLQIWILPDRAGHKPSYDQRNFSDRLQKEGWVKVVSGADSNAIHIHQDMELFVGKWDMKTEKTVHLQTGRCGWIQVVKGQIDIDGVVLKNGDALAIEDAENLTFTAEPGTELLYFDLPT